jgi:tripartite-type tricarboxylate transporter receptor subunit TctC
MIRTGHTLAICAAALGASLIPCAALAQAFPARAVRVIVPFTAGSAVDAGARITGQRLSEMWKQQVIIDNRVGANMMIGVEAGAKAAPDGYTLCLPNDAAFAVNPVLYSKVPYDPIKDFAPITQVAGITLVLISHPSFPVKSVKEFIALAKARPGEINYASGGVGSAQHIPMEMLIAATGIKVMHIPYKGLTPALNDAIGGQIPIMFAGLAGATPAVKGGRVRVLAVSGAKRSVALPDVPTVAEAGVPGYAYTPWFGYVAPAGTPRDVVNKINADVIKALAHPETNEKLVNLGFEIATNTPEQFAALIKSEIARMGKLVRETGMKAE